MNKFKNDLKFTTEFALRATMNYYQTYKKVLQQQYDSGERFVEFGYCKKSILNEIEKCDRQIQILHTKMDNMGYEECNFCMGTDLLVSLLGLIVLPYEDVKIGNDYEYYAFGEKKRGKFLTASQKKDFDYLPTLKKYVDKEKGEFENTYKFYSSKRGREYKEKNTPADIIHHMRNAISHEKLGVFPISSQDTNRVITDIVFDDDKISENSGEKMSFHLKIQIEDIEDIVMEISNYLCSFKALHSRS